MLQDEFYKALLIFITALTGIWKAVPLGFILKAHPTVIFFATAAGGLLSVLALYFSGNKIKNLILGKKAKERGSKKAIRVKRIFDRFGSPGLGILGTLLFGQIVTVLLGLLMVKSQKRFLLWVIAGTILCSLVLSIVGVYSIELFTILSDNIKLF